MTANNIERLLDGRVVVICSTNIEAQRVPLFCPCCQYPLRTMEDCVSYRKTNTCYHCDNRWANVKGNNLKNGQYPDKASSDWIEYLSFREIVGRNIFTLK
jgi:hypothetical protein